MVKKVLVLVMLVLVMALGAVAPAAWAGATPTVMINGVQVRQGDVKVSDGRVYVDIEAFNHLSGVFSLDNFTELTGMNSPEQETSVAALTAQVQGHNVLLSINKTDGSAYLATYSEQDVPIQAGPVTVIIDQGIVYVPVRMVATALGATVNWDQATQTATVTE